MLPAWRGIPRAAAAALQGAPVYWDATVRGGGAATAAATGPAMPAAYAAEQAIKTAMDKVPGTVVEAELEKKHGKTVWEVEILGADGKVTEVHIDAANGTVIDTEAKKEKHEDKKKK
jgi:hypothetical protein